MSLARWLLLAAAGASVVSPPPDPDPVDRYAIAETPQAGIDLRASIVNFAETNRFAGYQGQPTAGREYTADSAAALDATLGAITPDGVSWYRIRLRNGAGAGAWSRGVQAPIALDRDFGGGGLLIEPETGHDPQLDIRFLVVTNQGAARAVHVRGCCFVTRGTENQDGTGTKAYPVGTFSTAQPAYTAVRAQCPVLLIENNRFGRLFVPGMTVENSWKQWSVPIYIERAEQIILRNNVTNGVNGFARVYSARLLIMEDNDFRMLYGDVFQGNVWHDLSGYENSVFPDNVCYQVIRRNLMARQANITAYGNPSADIGHVDFYQNITTFGSRNAGRSMKRLIEDNVGIFLDMSEFLSDYNGIDDTGGGPLKWRTTSGSFVQDNTADKIFGVIGFNIMAVGINGMNVGPDNGGVNYIVQNSLIGPPDRPPNTTEIGNVTIAHYSHPGGSIVLRNNVMGAPLYLPNGAGNVDQKGTQVISWSAAGAYEAAFTGAFNYSALPQPASRWTLDETASKAAIMSAVRSHFRPKGGGSAYGWTA